MLSRRNATVVGAVVVGAGWIAGVTLLITHQDEPGAASAPELRQQLAAALADRDSGALSGLFDLPGSGGSDLADDYVRVLKDANAHDITVRLAPDERSPTAALVQGKTGQGTPFSYQLAVTTAKGRWTVAFTPPIP
ncbi:hypothetical protein [Amycolatopsis benzoatilytica]|uniref:hypothetical protein n=1 Tax=Amycolatopsis benzoatilytica TaxID=346045 RepID=UPI00037457B7|nr:hypothetical protein [Amycolatopsis benzoatilytica]